MGTAAEHLDAWERAGLIDRATADRLRAADLEGAPPPLVEPAEPPTAPPDEPASTLFGPPVSIAEVFGYLGAAFLLGAWFAWIANQASAATDSSWVIGIGASVAAIAMGVVGALLHQGDERQRRAAGVAFLVGLASVGTASAMFVGRVGLDWPATGVIATGTTLAFAIACRAFQPALLTQLGLLSALTSLVATALAWFEIVIVPDRAFGSRLLAATGPAPLLLVLGTALWWLCVAVVIGFIGLGESIDAERSGDVAAGRRAGLSRFWAGSVAVLGLASAVTRSDFDIAGRYGRVLTPWIGDLAVLVVVLVLIERAFRRESSAYVYAAALGLIVALSDLNVTYLSGGIETALLVEGLILLLAGVAADRLRRRIGRGDGPPSQASTGGELQPAALPLDDASPGEAAPPSVST
jgi:hypothetical protein